MRSGLIGWAKRIAATPVVIYIILALILIALTAHHLGLSPAAQSPAEAGAKASSASLSQIFHHPVNAPHNLLAYGLHKLSLSWQTSLRLSSVLFGLVFAWSFFALSRVWFGKYIGLMGALILASTPLFLVLCRQGTAEIMFLSFIPIMAIYLWSIKGENQSIGLAGLLIAAAFFLYIPGVIWLLAGSLIISRKKISAMLELAAPQVVAAGFLVALLLLVPLVLALIKDWTMIKTLVLIPHHFRAVLATLKEIAWMAITLFIRAPYHSLYVLGRLPVLSILQTALAVFGAYALWEAARPKLIGLAATVGFAVIVAGLNNDLSLLAFAIPALGIIWTAGLRYLYIEWRSVFPRNPLARIVALSLIALIVAVQLVFGLRYALVAWPAAAATRSTYVLK